VSDVRVFRRDDLPLSTIAREFVGAERDGMGVLPPLRRRCSGTQGPRLHRHPYAEIFIVQEGEATFLLGDAERLVRAGEIVVVPAGHWHGFVNSEDGPLRQIDIHVSPRFVTEWLDPAPTRDGGDST
jgi:mannose-6-phosphate isomerase-like protein (cupin superfamily)